MKASLLSGIVLLLSACGVQPSGVIAGGPAPLGSIEGTVLYLVSNQTLTTVLRPRDHELSPAETLTLLVAGPTAEEQAAHIDSDIPVGIGALTVTGDTVMLPVDVTSLSTMAVEQFVCTLATISDPGTEITLTGQGQTLTPRRCPI
ncbi:MAG: hypothetical protein ABW215_16920 [Kibdelosporangium sp.]